MNHFKQILDHSFSLLAIAEKQMGFRSSVMQSLVHFSWFTHVNFNFQALWLVTLQRLELAYLE